MNYLSGIGRFRLPTSRVLTFFSALFRLPDVEQPFRLPCHLSGGSA